MKRIIYPLLCGMAAFAATANAQNDVSREFPMRSEAVRRAVVIGVSTYALLSDTLKYATSDAMEFAAFLRAAPDAADQGGGVVFLSDGNATRGRVLVELGKLSKQTKMGDVAIIYFAGHGDVDTLTTLNDGYLLLNDAPPDKTYAVGGGLSVDELQRGYITPMLNRGVKVILITDACRSGNFISQNASGARATTAALIAATNSIRLVSSGADEDSYEGAEWGNGHGLFTYFLLKGLAGAARKDPTSRYVTLKELRSFVTDSVNTHRPRQMPQIEGDGRAILYRLPPGMRDESEEEESSFPLMRPEGADAEGANEGEAERAVPKMLPQVQDTLGTGALQALAQALRLERSLAQAPSAPRGPDPWQIYELARKRALPAIVLTQMAESLTLHYKDDSQRVIIEYQNGTTTGHDVSRVRRAAMGLTRLPLVSPDDADSVTSLAKAIFLFGYAEYQAGDVRRAITLLDSAARLNPRITVFHELLGRAYLVANDTNSARLSLKRAVDYAARWERPARLLAAISDSAQGLSSRQLAQLSDVSATFDSARVKRSGVAALVRPPSSGGDSTWAPGAVAYRDSARLALRVSDRFAAERFYVRAATLDAKNPAAFSELGAFYATDGRWPLAVNAYRQAIRLGTQSSELLTRLGDALLQAGGVLNGQVGVREAGPTRDSARTAFDQALQAEPEYAPALLGVGTTFQLAGDPVSAREWWRRALQAATERRDRELIAAAGDALAHSWLDQGRPDSAIGYWQRVLRSLGPSGAMLKPDISYQLGAAHAALGRWRESIQAYEQARRGFRGQLDAGGESDAVAALAVVGFRVAERAQEITAALARFDTASMLRVPQAGASRVPTAITAPRDPYVTERWVLAVASSRALSVDPSAPLHSLALVEALRGTTAGFEILNSRVTRTRVAEAIQSLAARERGWYISYFATSDTLLRWVISPGGSIVSSQVALSRDSLLTLIRRVERAPQESESEPSVPELELARVLLPDTVRSILRQGINLGLVPHAEISSVRFADLPVDSRGRLGDLARVRTHSGLVSLAPAQRGVIVELTPPAAFKHLTVITAGVRGVVDSAAVMGLLFSRARKSTPFTDESGSASALRAALGRSDFVHLTASLLRSDASVLLLSSGSGDTTLSAGQIRAGTWRSDSAIVVLDVPGAASGDLPAALLSRGAGAVLAPVSRDASAVSSEIARVYRHWFGDADNPTLDEAVRRARLSSLGNSRAAGFILFLPPPAVAAP